MNNLSEVFPAQSSVLDEIALQKSILPNYEIPDDAKCRFLTRGAADVYRVKTSEGNCYLKVYRPTQTLEKTEAEAQYVTALSNAGAPVVKPVPLNDGSFATQVNASEGVRPMLLFEEAPPPLPNELDTNRAGDMGETVATLHNTSDQFNNDFGIEEPDIDLFFERQVEVVSRFLDDDDSVYLVDVANTLSKILKRQSRQKPDFGLCHGDLVMSNIRLAEDGTVTLFDFGNTEKTWRTLELAIVHWSLVSRREESEHDLWEAFLKSYEAKRPLPINLTEVLPDMTVLRQIGFLGGNCATLPLRLGTELFEGEFLITEMQRLRKMVAESNIRVG